MESADRRIAKRHADRHQDWVVKLLVTPNVSAEMPLNKVQLLDERLCLWENGHQAICFMLWDRDQNPMPLSKCAVSVQNVFIF